METLKNCGTCYWSSVAGDNFADPCGRCSECDAESSMHDPYPKWTSKAPTIDLPKVENRSKTFYTSIFQALKEKAEAENDVVNHPKHYTVHPSGVECIQITEHMNFCLGNAIKYLWRAGDKHETPIEDLKKAVWYIQREIARLEKNEKV